MTSTEQGADPALPVVYLHIGTLKSGTSFLQGTLLRHRDLLAVNGVLFPGLRWASQVDAVRDILNDQRQPRRKRVVKHTWAAMSEEILAWHGRAAVFSMELLSLAQPDSIKRVVGSLHPAEVHVIITARDLARVIPSAWQESVQNRQTWTWEEYVTGLASTDDDEALPSHRFWRQQDLPRLVADWAAEVGLDHIHLVVVPSPGAPRDELWRRFTGVFGVDAGDYPTSDAQRGNPSIGAASAEFLRRVNGRLGKRFDVDLYEQYVKQYLAKQTLALRADEERLELPEEYDQWARDRAHAMVNAIADTGIDVRGDLTELIPAPATPGRAPVTIDEHDVAEAGVHAVAALVRVLAETQGDDPGLRRSRGRRRRRLG